MDINKINNMIGGWFIGNFEPSLMKTNEFEVAVKTYKRGDYEESHFHKVATEFTVIVKGKVKMMGKEYLEGSIITIHPMESTDFLALSDSTTVVVKTPCVPNDKFLTKKK